MATTIALETMGATLAAAETSQASLHLVADTGWLKIPDGKLIGDVSAVAVDHRDNVWILTRPRSVAGADRARALPPVLKFDRDGRFVAGWGGAGQGYDWPTTEHSIAVDRRGHVWVSGSFRADAKSADDMVLEFTGKGEFVKQIGVRGASHGDGDTANLHAPGDIFVDDTAREVYVADGYGNRRIIVFDEHSGRFKRMWSGFGAPPPAEAAPDPRPVGTAFTPDSGDGPAGFNGVHGVEVSRDGLVYVSDRNNQRVQIFTRKGKYIRQFFVDRNMPSPQSASGIAFSPDKRQRTLYIADWGNSRLLVYDRDSLSLLGSIGERGTAPGQFIGPHLIATDSRGHVYVAEVVGRRLQRLTIERPAR
ncbi:hypothetical protein PX699_28485 [Sphingobium sp. H39-3-25]|uniref:hypothetical protein n=1 Tax=Sphingobium arseniciresistens TaxID=3030834 RepID=UPI0023B9A60F|nr:hypothetical protein [Sphingobium arseniciresistens]